MRTTKKITVQNVMKVIDVDIKDIHTSTHSFLVNFHIIYRDTILKEHIINIADASEAIEGGDFEHNNAFIEVNRKEIEELQKLCNDNESDYVRFTEI